MWKYLEHTADAMFEAEGKTLEQAFSNSALAMFNILTDITKVKQTKKFKIEVSANTLEKLLFDFLDELLFYLDTEHMIFSKILDMKIKKDDVFVLSCEAIGDIASNYITHGDIKAPTYNEMKITQSKNKVICRVVVDI